MSIKVLLFGANGNLGSMIKKYSFASNSEIELISWTREDGNVTQFDLVKEKLLQIKPNVVINTIAYNGVDEVDMVINIGALRDGNEELVLNDIQAVVDAAKDKALVKVIIETALLTEEEIIKACQLAQKAGADFVKTSTGFSTSGAKAKDVALMRQTVGPDMGVKASGGIHTAQEAQSMLDAGATRLGVSASMAIIAGEKGTGY